jgi:hypothetical protein
MKLVRPAVCLGLAALTLAAVVGDASARPRKKHYTWVDPTASHEITVTRRSFLDSGTNVPVGSRNAYVQEIIRFERPPLANTSPDVLWRPDPGPSEPIF